MSERYQLYSSPMLRASAEVVQHRVRIGASGLLACLPPIRSALQMFDCQMPAYFDSKRLCLSTWIPPVPSLAFDRLAQSRVRGLLGLRTPDQVTISITEECPNHCSHCALPNSGRKLRLSPQTVKDIIGQVLDMGATLVIFDGGEPALYPGLPELVASVGERAVATLFTSGAGFTAELARQLKEAGLYAVNVSLDSPLPEEHDAMRGRKGVFGEAMQAARLARQAGLLVDIYVVLRRENIVHLQRFHELAAQAGAHELTLFEVVATGRWSEREGIALRPEDHRLLDGFVMDAGTRPPRIFSVPEAYRHFGCFAATSWMHITPGGDVYPCSCYPQSWGSIFDRPIREIWREMRAFPFKKSKICPMRK